MNINANASTQRLDPQISIKGLESALGVLDANRADGYAQLGRARAAKSSSLARETKLLARKYDGQTTPRAEFAAATLKRNETFRRDIAAAGEVLESPAPQVDENTFVIYGFVRRRDQTGIPSLTLALTDEQGTWIKEGGYACTDKRGYFELRIGRAPKDDGSTKPDGTTRTPEEEEKLKREAEAKAEAERKAAAEAAAKGQTPAAAAAAAAAGAATTDKDNVPAGGTGAATRINTNASMTRTGIQLRVFNSAGRVLHVEARPVVPKVNSVDYRLIILGDEDCGCTPPPEKSDGQPTPTVPRAPSAPPAAPAQPAPSPVTPRVANLKFYEPNAAPGGVALEAIRGIGPKTADKLRAAGIQDVEAFAKTEGEALVKLAGFDKVPPKTPAETPKVDPKARAAETPQTRTPNTGTPTTTTDKAAPEAKASVAAVEKATTKAAESKAATKTAAETKATVKNEPTAKVTKTTAAAKSAAKIKKDPK